MALRAWCRLSEPFPRRKLRALETCCSSCRNSCLPSELFAVVVGLCLARRYPSFLFIIVQNSKASGGVWIVFFFVLREREREKTKEKENNWETETSKRKRCTRAGKRNGAFAVDRANRGPTIEFGKK